MTTPTPGSVQWFPYARTTCACRSCVQCCKDQPGSLIPGDFERIRDHLGITDAEARTYFWDSPGALVMNTLTGTQWQIRTITPRYARGRCVFLDKTDRCRIYAVAPAGCAYFDTHMREEGHDRAVAMVTRQQDPEYQALRQTLIVATHYKGRRV